MADRTRIVRPSREMGQGRASPAAPGHGASPAERRLADLSRLANAAPGHAGLPGHLAARIEALSGLSMHDVRVHRGSALPAGVGALAFARGTDIHLAPGQERHLPHEAWHVVQQKQGRVRATGSVAGVLINDDPRLEAEAETMSARIPIAATPRDQGPPMPGTAPVGTGVVQRAVNMQGTPLKLTRERFDKLFGETKGRAARKRLGSRFSRDDVWTQIQTWMSDDDPRDYYKFERLFDDAVTALHNARDLAEGFAPPVTTLPRHGSPTDPATAPAIADKVTRSAELRRRASLSINDQYVLRTNQKRTFHHSDDPALEYRVTGWGDKLDGGFSKHSYEDIVTEITRVAGDARKAAAAMADALEGLPYPRAMADVLRKFVSIVHFSELSRAAINPAVMYAALRTYAATKGDPAESLFDYLLNRVLFVMAEDDNKKLGGAAMSRHHRKPIPQDHAGHTAFSAITSGEYDMLVEFAASQGVNLSAPDALDTYVESLSQFLRTARERIFPTAGRSHKPPQAAPTTGIVSSSPAHAEPRSDSHLGKRSAPEGEKPTAKRMRNAPAFEVADARDTREVEGHAFNPSVNGIRDLGECLWDNLRRAGINDATLLAASVHANTTRGTNLVVDQHVDVRDLIPLVEGLNAHGALVHVRLVAFDLRTLAHTSTANHGDRGTPIYIGMFHDGEHGHFTPGMPVTRSEARETTQGWTCNIM